MANPSGASFKTTNTVRTSGGSCAPIFFLLNYLRAAQIGSIWKMRPKLLCCACGSWMLLLIHQRFGIE